MYEFLIMIGVFAKTIHHMENEGMREMISVLYGPSPLMEAIKKMSKETSGNT